MTHGPAASDDASIAGDSWLATAQILVVDDEPGRRNFLVRTRAPRCARVEERTRQWSRPAGSS